MKYIRVKPIIFGTISLLVFLTTYWFWLDYKEFLKTPIIFTEAQRSFTLKKGSSVNRLAKRLELQGNINHQWKMKLLAYQKPELTALKAGEYYLKQMMVPEVLLRILNEGQVIQYPFTIIEGQTAYQIIKHLAQDKRLLVLEDTSDHSLTNALALNYKNIEGWLFPESYYYTQGDSALSILKRASVSMKNILNEEWLQRSNNLPYSNAYEALIMASIIEKETGIASERSKIAGVFVRRLQKKMRLGTDPTVIYGIGPSFNGDITRKDLDTLTPYNTRLIKGLPPTPIAMPSREAIVAALHPDSGKTLYFVADGTGGHYFSETLKEHNLAVRRMLKRNKKRGQ